MMFITRWKAKRELKKSIKIVEKMCDEMPNSFFKGLIANADGTFVEPIEARNILMHAVFRMKREL
jgi:hypothetical protein